MMSKTSYKLCGFTAHLIRSFCRPKYPLRSEDLARFFLNFPKCSPRSLVLLVLTCFCRFFFTFFYLSVVTFYFIFLFSLLFLFYFIFHTYPIIFTHFPHFYHFPLFPPFSPLFPFILSSYQFLVLKRKRKRYQKVSIIIINRSRAQNRGREMAKTTDWGEHSQAAVVSGYSSRRFLTIWPKPPENLTIFGYQATASELRRPQPGKGPKMTLFRPIFAKNLTKNWFVVPRATEIALNARFRNRRDPCGAASQF